MQLSLRVRVKTLSDDEEKLEVNNFQFQVIEKCKSGSSHKMNSIIHPACCKASIHGGDRGLDTDLADDSVFYIDPEASSQEQRRVGCVIHLKIQMFSVLHFTLSFSSIKSTSEQLQLFNQQQGSEDQGFLFS